METVIVEISVPAINEKIDFRLPSTAKIKDVIAEIARILETVKGNLQFDPDTLLLCDLDKGAVLNPSQTVADQHLQDGATLELV